MDQDYYNDYEDQKELEAKEDRYEFDRKIELMASLTLISDTDRLKFLISKEHQDDWHDESCDGEWTLDSFRAEIDSKIKAHKIKKLKAQFKC